MQKNPGSAYIGVINFMDTVLGHLDQDLCYHPGIGNPCTYLGLEATIICLTLLLSDHSKSNVKAPNLVCAIPCIMRRYLESHPWAVCIEVSGLYDRAHV